MQGYFYGKSVYQTSVNAISAGLSSPQIIWNIFLSPLRPIPGPLLAKATSKWLLFIDLAGNRTTTLHNLHKRYGPAVRVGPKEVSYANVEAVKEIYSQQTQYMKAPIYDDFSKPYIGIFSMRNKAEHSQRRRLLSHAFSQSNLNNTEPLIKQKVEKLVTIIDGQAGKLQDMLLLFRLLAFDIIGN